jgi:hypothetical protein
MRSWQNVFQCGSSTHKHGAAFVQTDKCRISQLENLLRAVVKDHEEFDGLGKVLLAEIETVLGEKL